jgi:hypothetical protein
VGFGNTAEEQYEIILGTPPNAADGSLGRRGVFACTTTRFEEDTAAAR